MSSEGWICNIPGVITMDLELSQGIARVHEKAQVIEIEPWVTERNGTMTFYREDAAVLRYLADALESFDQPRPAETDEPGKPEEQQPQEPEPEKKTVIRTNGKPAGEGLQQWALK